MAFKKAPEQDTYSTVEFPIIKEINSRDYNNSKDALISNAIVESVINKVTQEHELSITKRAGYTSFYTGANILKLHSSPPVLGSTGTVYSCSTSGVVRSHDMTNSGSFGAGTTIFTFTSGSNIFEVKFADFKYDNGTQSVMVGDGTELWEITGGSATEVTDAQFPTPFAPQSLECMDGYVFVATALGDIYNSDLNNPQSWTAGNFIATEMANDQVWILTKLSNYLVAIGTTSTEFFYNAGIATGSPLQRNTSLYKPLGTINSSFANGGGFIYFAGIETPSGSGIGIYQLGLDSLKKISNDAIEKKLTAAHLGTGQSNWKQRVALNLFVEPASGCSQLAITIVGSSSAGIVTDSGYYWLNLDNGTVTTSSLQLLHTITTMNTASVFIFFVFGSYRLIGSGSNIFYFDSAATQDNGSNFTFSITTDLEDFDTINRKQMSRLVLVGEKPASTASVSVSWTDDDYQNFNTPISVDMFQDLPSIQRLGRFRRRALKITGTHALPFSLSRIEVDINKGNT